ncbi:TPM domain-containing protein [Carboxylicivirga marina]|uniref:TPM domain-containing protein n=1 Tax=Carboxylicivirga marina TaxID=2800988 RepID=UPI0025958ACD|nr:TPM domain-containing protein [uncultured Carboxylicivirga sp.]
MNKILYLVIFVLHGLSAQGQLIVDNGNFFSDKEISELINKMQKIENETSVQTLIYTTMDLNGKTPIEYGLELGTNYKVGIKGVNNGILILLSKNERKVQVINGYGIEWIISDNETQKIVDQMIPFFKQQNFFGGVNNALTLIENEVSKIVWSINTSGLSNLSENNLGEIIKFDYTNETGNIKYKYAIDSDSQFSNDFKVILKSNHNEFSLYYSKNMNDFISTILTKKDIVVYARLTDWKNKRLELLGIE